MSHTSDKSRRTNESDSKTHSDIVNSKSCDLPKTCVNADKAPGINLDGELNISDYLKSVPVSQKVANELSNSLAKQKEAVRSKLAIGLIKIFGLSSVASFLLILITTIYPPANKIEIKDLILAVITPQVTLLSVATGFYFGNNKEN